MIEPQMKTPPADIKSAVTDKYTQAYNLNVRICVNAQMAQQNLWEMCKALKEMHDNKLYKELGYNSFESYTEAEVGIKRHQAQKYLAVAELENGDTCQHLGLSKLALLAKLDEPQREEIQQTVNVEDVSVRELKSKIDDLKKANDRLMDKVDEAEKKAAASRKSEESACGKLSILRTDLEMQQQKTKQLEEEKSGYKERQDKLLKKNMELVEECDKAKQEAEKAEKRLRMIEINDNMANVKIKELEEQIKELENRPRDAYEDTTKIDELKKQLAEAEERHRAELANAQAIPAEDVRGVFKAYMIAAVDALRNLTQFTENHMNAPEKSIFIEKLESVDILINQTISKLKGV